jgi:diadenosine tetraphosphatase ApaH/serine/threonine PP2A family protein phosphatase
MWAIISDIHGNLEALQAVFTDIAHHPVKRLLCLGDIVGYGPNPVECLELVMAKCEFSVLGNHDQGAMFDPPGWSPVAEQAIYWTRDELERKPPARGKLQPDERWDYLSGLQQRRKEGNYLFVHGSARNPVNEYVFPEDIYNQRKMESIFSQVDRYGFQGHTHVPGIFLEEKAGELYQFYTPEETEHSFPLDGRKTMCNVGSVGQPRDGDPRACYVLLEDDKITFRRVPYDFDATAKKIYDVPALDNFLGDRLRQGR